MKLTMAPTHAHNELVQGDARMVGTLAGIDLGFRNRTIHGGAGFPLSKSSPVDWGFTTSAGAVVFLREEASSAVVRLPVSLNSPDEILEAAHLAVQEALDVLGMQAMHFLATPKAEYDHLLWWREGDEVVARWCDVARLNVRVEASWEKKSADGTTLETSADAPLPAWHEAMRYFRQSQLRDDLYTAYRDAYLALESILSTVAPQNTGEGERAWHIRACNALQANGVDFGALLEAASTSPVEDFVDDQFKAHRCALFHAKANKHHLLPGVLTDRRVVAAAMERLGRFVTQAARTVLGTNNLVGVLTLQGMKMQADLMAADLELAVSDDRTVADAADTEISPAGAAVTMLPTTYLGVVDGIGYDFGLTSEIAVADMASPVINTTASRVPGALMTRGNVEDLDIEGADRFQYYSVLSFSGRAGLKGGFDL